MKNQEYYAVLDSDGVIFGIGETKKEALKDACYWQKANGHAKLPFKLAVPCTKSVWEDCSVGTITVNGVLHTKDELLEKQASDAVYKAMTNQLPFAEFKELENIPLKLDILFIMLQKVMGAK